MSQLYLIKDKKGRIFGPYTEEEICFHIEEGEIKGDELFSDYPTGKWQALSISPVFYEKIIAQLHQSKKDTQVQNEDGSLSEPMTSEELETLEPTRILKIDSQKSSTQKKKVKIKLSREFRDEVLEEEGYQDVIDMEEVVAKKTTSSKLFRYGGLFAGIFLVLFLILNSSDNSATLKAERLLAPYKTRPELTKKELQNKLKSTLKLYKESSIQSYLKAQKNYVEILESFSKEDSIYPLLCLIYLEIWPLSYQDTKDKQSLQRTLYLTQNQLSNKIYSNFCTAVSFYIDKKFKEVIDTMDYLLFKQESQSSQKKPAKNAIDPLFIFYVKALALKNLNSNKKALSLLNTITNLNSSWVAPLLLKADIYYENQQYNLAISEYLKVLKIYPNHPVALIRLGVLEYKHLRQAKKSQKTLLKVLSKGSQKVTPDILFEAYMVLADNYYNQKKENRFVEYLKKAYALRPDEPDVVKLKSKTKNQKVFKEIKFKPQALVYKGDLVMSKGDCLNAVEFFKKAYKFTRSGLAAFKAGQCFWKMGMSGDAIRWLKKAINVEVDLLDAYLLLADYLSQIYQFDHAGDILSTVVRKYPNHPDIYKAYLKLSFRREFYDQAITYGGKVLKFYPYDVETLVLLSRSYFDLEKVNIAYTYAKKAILQNPKDSSAQISYALTLDYTGGSEDTEAYLRKMMQNFPNLFEYHQALGEYFFNRGNYKKAEKEFVALVTKNSKLKEAYMHLGLVYIKLGVDNKQYYELAIKQFREASLLDLSDVQPFFYVGQIHLNNKNHGEAYNEFYRIIQINPNYPLIYYYLGLTILSQKGTDSLDKALKAAQTGIVKNPKHYLPYKLAGDVYRLKSNLSFKREQDRKKVYDLCAKEYQKALKYVEKSIAISMNLLACYKGAGHLNLALELAENLTKEEGMSGYPEIYREIGSIFEFKEEYERANSYYNIYFQLLPTAPDREKIKQRIAFLMEQKKKISEPKEE